MKRPSNEVHIIPTSDATLFFHRPTYSLLRIKEKLDEIPEEVAERLKTLSPTVKEVTGLRAPTLYLHVSNACNLACVYCYANGGSYNSAPGVMTEELAIQSVNQFFDTFGSIGVINFFGGEPMLQTSLFETVCEHALAEAEKRNVRPPSFSVVTNGTMLTEENVALLVKYKFGVTVSIDGSGPIHDALRPQVNGKGSFAKVYDGMMRLKRHGIHPNVEATFTAKHFRMGLTPKSLLQYFRQEFQTPTITVAPVASTPGEEVSLSEYYEMMIPAYREAARFSLETLETRTPIVLYQVNHVLHYLLTKTKKPTNQFCYTHLGEEHFTVSSKGGIYPCQMMNDEPRYEMGKIMDGEFHKREQFKNVQNIFRNQEKNEMQCRNCWAQELCFMCVAGVEIETGKLKPIPKHRCDLIKGIIEEILIYMAQTSKS